MLGVSKKNDKDNFKSGQLSLEEQFGSSLREGNSLSIFAEDDEKELEELKIKETLTRSEWEERLKEKELESQAESVGQEEYRELELEKEMEHPSNDLYGRWGKFKR